MSKQDTKFGELIRAEAKRLYGDDFEFDKCTIEREFMDVDEERCVFGYVVTFEMVHDEPAVMDNFPEPYYKDEYLYKGNYGILAT